MEELFDFDSVRRLFAGGFRMTFDAMHAITGHTRAVCLRSVWVHHREQLSTVNRCRTWRVHPDPNLVRAGFGCSTCEGSRTRLWCRVRR
jgi:phosphoglucomutase